MKIVITGGHHTAALPVIEELQESISDIQIFWFGHRYSLKGNKNDTLEYKEITALDIPFVDLKAGKFYKTHDPIRLLRIPFGFFQALFNLVKIKPDVILSFGGYLAVPTVLAGWFLHVPSVTHEQTVVSGYANRCISKFVKKVLVSWEASTSHFPKNKVVYTGLPLRRSLFEVRSNSFEVNQELPTIYITAGKTGSHKINEIVKTALPKLLSMCNVIHQCGAHSQYDDYNDLLSIYREYEEEVPGKYFLREFVLEEEIGEVFSKACLFVCRAGAHTVKEVITFRKQAVLIPIPWVSHNEQCENAKVVKKEGLGVILDEKELVPEKLISAVYSLLRNLPIEEHMSVYDNTPAEKIVEVVKSL